MKDFAKRMQFYALLWMFSTESAHCTVLAKKEKRKKLGQQIRFALSMIIVILSLAILIINYVIVLAIICDIDFTI